jgi:outer membrane protein
MKKLFILMAGVVLMLGFQHQAFCAGGNKFGVVDIEKFQGQSKSFQKIREGLQQKFAALQKKLDEKKDELIEIENELKKQSMMLSLDAKEDKAKELGKEGYTLIMEKRTVGLVYFDNALDITDQVIKEYDKMKK